MRYNSVVALLGAVAVVLTIVCGVFTFLGDRRAPVISFTTEDVSFDGTDTESLLEGVAAEDGRDGDVTDSVILSEIFQTSENGGIAVYAARDKKNNISKASRAFTYTDDAVLQDRTTNTTGALDLEAEETEENSANTREPADEEAVVTDNETGTAGTETVDRDTQLAAGIPYLKLVQTEATIKRGETFNVLRYIEEAVDDKDDASRMLHTTGTVDVNLAGTYEVQVYIRDSEGNVSNTETLTVTVEP